MFCALLVFRWISYWRCLWPFVPSAILAVSQLIKLNLAHICNFILPCSWLLLSAEFAEPTKEENNNLWCRFGHWLAWLILTFDPNNTKQPSADLPYLQNLLQTPMTSSDNAQWESALVVHGHFTISVEECSKTHLQFNPIVLNFLWFSIVTCCQSS